MANIKGITIELAGKTSDLVKGLNQADKALKNTNDALKAVNKALELDPSNVELAAQKEALLAEAVNQTEDRLQALRQAAELAAQGLEDGTTTQAQYAQLTAEIAATEAQMDGLGEETQEAGDQAKESSEKWEGFGSAVGAAAAAAAAAIAAVTAAAVAAGTALVNCTVEGGKFADEILTMSTVTGVSTQTLQEWSYAAELVDVDMGTMTGALTKTTKAIFAVSEGSASATEAFDKLGVSALDSNGNMRDSEDVFWDIIDALGEIDNETERDALAMELLGKSAQDLNPLIEAGSEGMAEYAEMAHEAGYVLDDETLGAFGEFDNQLQRLNSGSKAAKNALGTILLPTLTQMAGSGVDLLGEFTNAVLDADGDISKISEIISEMIPQIIDAIMEFLPTLVELAGSLIGAVGQGLLDNLDIILEAAINIITAICDGMLEALPQITPVVIEAVVLLANNLIQNLPTIIEAAVQIILAITNGLTQAMPQLIPTMVQAIITMQTALIDHLPEIIEAGVELTGAIVEGLIQSLPAIVSGALQITAKLLETLLGAGPELIKMAVQWGKDLIDSFVQGLKDALPNLKAGLEGIGGTIKSYLHFTSPDVGPLANDLIGKSGADMITTFADGMRKEMGTLQTALNVTGQTIATGVTGAADYSGVLSGIQSSLSNFGRMPIQVNVMVGGEQLDSYIINATNNNDFRSGGF